MNLHRAIAWKFCAFSLLWSNVACAQNAAPLPLQNGGFENGLNGWTAREKVPMSAPSADAAHEGKMGLRVQDDDATAGSSLNGAPISIVGGQSYRLTFWAKTTANAAAVVQFRFADAQRKALNEEAVRFPIKTTGNGWTQLSFSDRAPQNATNLAVWIHSYPGAKATIDLDDFSLANDDAGTVTAIAPLPVSPAEKATEPVSSTKPAEKATEPASSTNAPRQSPPYIIIKADDLRNVNGRVHARWKKFAEFIKERKVHASIGLIGNSLEGDNPAYISWIKEQQATGLFEFWNHGYVHEPTKVDGKDVQEFKGPTYEQQKEHYSRTQQLAREKLGFAFATFGAPSNSFDANTVRVLEEDADTKVWLFGDDEHPAGKLILDRVYPVNIERPLFVPSLENFVEGYNRYPQRRYFVIQGHAAKWDDARFEQFTKIVDFLIAQKAVFVTPSEYAKIQAAPAP